MVLSLGGFPHDGGCLYDVHGAHASQVDGCNKSGRKD